VIATFSGTDLPPRWPSAVRAELDRRHALVLERVAGSVLDIGAPDGRDLLRRTLEGEVTVDRFDAVVSVAGLVRFADLAAAWRAIEVLLAPGGVVAAIEPVGVPGFPATLLASAGALLPAVRGVHVQRDVVGAQRAAGFIALDLARFDLPTRDWPLRHWVSLRGRRRVDGPGRAEGRATVEETR